MILRMRRALTARSTRVSARAASAPDCADDVGRRWTQLVCGTHTHTVSRHAQTDRQTDRQTDTHAHAHMVSPLT